MQRMLYDCDKTLQLQTNDLDVDTMYEIRVKEAAQSAVLFISIVTNSRYTSFSIPVFDRFLEKFFEPLETRISILENIEYRGSSRDCQLTFDRYCILTLFMMLVKNLHACGQFFILFSRYTSSTMKASIFSALESICKEEA